jgi:glycosyltransferase involved in cell wall biosynthesis
VNQVKVVIDTSVLRRPHTGTARWVTGLVDALSEIPTLAVQVAPGPHRLGNGLFFRPANLTRQRWWYDHGIRRFAGEHGADALLMPSGYSARRGGIPQLVSILDVNFLTSPGTYESLFTRYAAWAMKRSAHAADRLVTISEFSRTEISRHFAVDPERISVVYPGLNPPRDVTRPSPLDVPYALYVGATEPSKNLGVLLDAWSDSSPAGLAMVVVGQPGRYHRTLQRRASTMGGRVIVRGRVDQNELDAWYRGAAIFLFPSLTEGFGYPPLEAMQRSVPVISSNCTCLPEVLGDAALYHDPDDPLALREQVERLMGDEALRRRQVALGVAQAAKYRWQTTGKQIAQLLASMVDGNGR